MDNKPPELNQFERDQLLQWFAHQSDQNSKSSDSINRIITDRGGRQHSIGGELHCVIMGDDSIPRGIAQEHNQVLDCGHIVSSMSDVLGMCDFGHIICREHELYTCQKCRRLMCDRELQQKKGRNFCPDCITNYRLIIIIILAIIVLIILIAIFSAGD